MPYLLQYSFRITSDLAGENNQENHFSKHENTLIVYMLAPIICIYN